MSRPLKKALGAWSLLHESRMGVVRNGLAGMGDKSMVQMSDS